jgi:hypothetical protein
MDLSLKPTQPKSELFCTPFRHQLANIRGVGSKVYFENSVILGTPQDTTEQRNSFYIPLTPVGRRSGDLIGGSADLSIVVKFRPRIPALALSLRLGVWERG